MGAFCSKKSKAAQPSARKAAVEVSNAPQDPASPQPPLIPASSVCPSTKPAGKMTEFVTGEGDGVYLMLVGKGATTSLDQQYAHSRPEVEDPDSLLLQIKPPVYVEIKESRFLLQNGRRTLKTGILLAMNTPDGQKKVCEAVMECLRLTSAYSAYIHTYPGMAVAPFSVALVAADIKDEDGGLKYVAFSSVEDPASSSEVVVAATEESPKEAEEAAKNEEGRKSVEAEAGAKHGEKEEGQEGKKEEPPTIFQDSPQTPAEVAPLEVYEQVAVLRHLQEGRSPNFSSLRFLIVLPLSRAQAQEALKDGRVIGEADVEALKKQVEELHGVMTSTEAIKDA
ncbi:hypothetical protein ACSSS7_001557 [Eimeria intestinalis]